MVTQPIGDLQLADDTEPATEIDDVVHCAACDGEVTLRSLAVQRDGRHEHTFRNPAGYSWTVVCFHDAPGCRSMGDLTTAASWFPAYAWCFAHCIHCGRHIGWWYVGGGPSFVGLIATRLR